MRRSRSRIPVAVMPRQKERGENVMVNRFLRSAAILALGAVITSCGTPLNDAEEMQQATVEVSETSVRPSSAVSPDGRFRIETHGINTSVTAGGLYPAEQIRVVDAGSGDILWFDAGAYDHEFAWSPDSRYVAVFKANRTATEAFILDTDSLETALLPSQPERIHAQDADVTSGGNMGVLSGPYLRPVEWLDRGLIRVAFEWTGGGDDRFSGSYVYDVAEQEIVEVEWFES